jgi:hydrogenase large subunit
MQDHVVHFYHLHALDWVDVVSALKADPKATSELAQSISKYRNSSPGYFADAQTKVKNLVESGQLGIFANAYWGHPEYKLPPEANLMAVAHYLDALAWQRDVSKLHAVFGGKNPHPNFVVGGAPTAFSGGPGGNGQTTMNDLGLNIVRDAIIQMQEFVDQVYVPDTLAIASFYKDWFERGEGIGNFLTCGDFPAEGHGDLSSYLIPSGVILDRDLSTIHPLDLNDPEQVQEFISRSWYEYEGGKDVGLHPYDGETTLNYTGPQTPYKFLDVEKDYSWLKSPRWRGRPMEVGPLARVLMLYASGHEPTKELASMALSQLDLPLTAMFSTMGRTAARTLETKIIADTMMTWYDNLMANLAAGNLSTFNEDLWHPKTWPKQTKGVGYMEAPRGALAHYTVIEDGKLTNYQAVVPSTWNAGPRDPEGQPGPYEAALMDNHQMHDVNQPLEILRTIHSFDPCLACAVHMVGPDGKKGVTVKIT